APLEAEVDALRSRLARLEKEAESHAHERAKLERLATFPEQNPNLVVETDRDGRVTYVNPVARDVMPDLDAASTSHVFLRGLDAIIAAFEQGASDKVWREVDTGSAIFEQQITRTQEGDRMVVRVYAHDVTARRRAEAAIQTLARQVVMAQEEERHRVSRELHDEAGQALTALKISLQLIRDDLPARLTRVAGEIDDVIGLVDHTRESLRALAHGLRPPALDALGVVATIEDHCRAFGQRTGLRIEFRAAPDAAGLVLQDAASICLYRCVQEALTNVARHAGATDVTVTFDRSEAAVRVTVADDGAGFDTDARPEGQGAGLGLVGMRERLELLGGGLTVDGTFGRGVRLVATLPLPEPAVGDADPPTHNPLPRDPRRQAHP
ncbi:MAG: sensor histidine kinase, partial [Ardenticatenales bacterium]